MSCVIISGVEMQALEVDAQRNQHTVKFGWANNNNKQIFVAPSVITSEALASYVFLLVFGSILGVDGTVVSY